MKRISAILTFLICSNAVVSQTPITLQECADRMLKNDMLVVSENKSLLESKLNLKFHYWTMIPTLSSSIGFNTYFGRRVDPFTNTFATKTVNSQSFGLNSGITVFNGLSYVYNKRKLSYLVQQGQLNFSNKKNDQLIRLIELYTTLCKQQLLLDQSTTRLEKYRKIQLIQKQLINGGRISAIDTLKSKNSLLTEELLVVRLETDQRLAMIELNYLMGEPLTTHHTVSLESITELTNRPVFKEEFELDQLEMEQLIAQDAFKLNRASIMPSLTLNGNLGTGFSTNNKDYSIDGNPTKPYPNQLQQNMYEGIGLYLSIPILNRGSWLKSRQIDLLNQSAINEEIALKKKDLEKSTVEIEQRKITIQAEIKQSELIVFNLEEIYDKTLMLYQEGRLSYLELELTFLEWQSKLTELGTLKLDHKRLLMMLK